MKKVLLTGGGTAGHVTPNLALVPYLKSSGFDIEYMGSYNGIEKKLVEAEGIPYTGIDSGKLRRYISLQNLKDPAHILKGIREAKAHLRSSRPDVVFSKGGFVAVPVVFAAKSLNIPIVIHESDLTPGLANKLCIPKADKICFSFPETEKYLAGKGILTGLPVRDSLLAGDAVNGMMTCNFTGDKPILMIMGGSLGSANINNAVREALPALLERFQIVHICGAGKTDDKYSHMKGYVQFEYVNKGIGDLMAMSDILISRAGANSVFEILALRKPALLIPLGTKASRGDQILNAESFKKRGFAEVLADEDLTCDTLVDNIDRLYENRLSYIDAMDKAEATGAAKKVADIIVETANRADIRQEGTTFTKE